MSAPKHTPGPWVNNNGLVFGRSIDNLDLPSFDIFDSADWPGPDEEAVANSALIAAAPDLLHIVQRFIALPGGAWHPERHAAEEAELMRDAAAIVSKADGDA